MLSAKVRVFVATQAVDLRKGFDGLAAVTRHIIEQDPLSGHVFVFFNRRRDRVKVLVWQRTGYVLLYKRLERGRFQVPACPESGQRRVEIDAASLLLLLEGVGLEQVMRRRVWEAHSHATRCDKSVEMA